MLLTGVERTEKNTLEGINAFQCCRPCKSDGTTSLTVRSCAIVGWYQQMSEARAGWAMCPADSYLQGFYKGTCTDTVCLEQGEESNVLVVALRCLFSRLFRLDLGVLS